MPFLEVENVSKHFGGVAALSDVSFHVDKYYGSYPQPGPPTHQLPGIATRPRNRSIRTK